MRYIVVQDLDGLIVNAILWDGVSPWEPPAGCFVIQNDILNIGDTYIP